VRRGELWRYDPVISRAGQSPIRLIVSADALNAADGLPTVYGMQLAGEDPESLLAVQIGEYGWALTTAIERLLRRRMVELVGRATTGEMEQVDSALRAAFDL
jgi:mRNA-degrading endonuclease toxin of MazEF toxin-antitoxin module